jgi:tetratricopeptide (TPR) repeat protein
VGLSLIIRAMWPSVAVRAAIVLLCAAGIVVSIVSHRSQRNIDEGFERVVAGVLDDRTRELLEDARPLNPDTRIDQGLASVDNEQERDGLPRLRDALEREPDNVGLVFAYGVLLAGEGYAEESARAYDRASELDPQRYRSR